MTSFFSVMIYITTIVGFAVTTVFFGGIIIKSRSIACTQTFANCDTQMKTCRITSIIFAILYWLGVSGLNRSDCLAGYAKLSTICSRLGCTWIILAIISIVISVYLGIVKREQDEITIMVKLRTSCFKMGAIFLMISFVSKVG